MISFQSFLQIGAVLTKNRYFLVKKIHFFIGTKSVETLDFSMISSTCHYYNSKPRGSAGPAQTQYIGNHIGRYVFSRGVVPGYPRKQKPQKGRNPFCQFPNQSGAGSNLHQPHPQSHHTGHGKTQRKSFPRAVQRRVGHLAHPSRTGPKDHSR